MQKGGDTVILQGAVLDIKRESWHRILHPPVSHDVSGDGDQRSDVCNVRDRWADTGAVTPRSTRFSRFVRGYSSSQSGISLARSSIALLQSAVLKSIRLLLISLVTATG